MSNLDVLLLNPWLFTLSTGLLGLIVGSFLNVVIHRLPRMLEHSWRKECEAFLELPSSQTDSPALNLITPRSHCPHCGQTIRAHENIPVLSYLMLRGRCAHCKAVISPRYPCIECMTALLSVIVAGHFGPTLQTAMALILSWSLICLSVIDFDRQLLPDDITYPLLWLGLLLSLFGIFTDPASSIVGAIAGYMSLWSIYQLFKLLTGKEGMGHGDFKLLAVFGAWLGWQMLLPIVLLSSMVGAVVGISMVLVLRHDRSIPIPFGPYLAAAGWIALLWGRELVSTYLEFAGLS